MLDAISHITTAIDKMKREHVIKKLATLNLATNGTKKILRKRLKRYYNHLRIAQYHLMLPYSERMQLDYLVVIDFEATCDEYNANVVQEIIEFPAVLVDVRNQTIAQVDRAKDFTDVLRDFEDWLFMLNLGTDYKFAVVTDGHWDMSQLFKFQLELTGIALPCWAEQWVSIRKVYRAFYDSGFVNLLKMLNKSGMEFRGRRHCGLDDAINIAALAIKLLHDGCIFTCNEYLCSYDSNIHLGVPEPNKTSPFSTLLTEVASHNLDSKTVEHSDVLEQTWGNLFMPGPFGYLPHDSWATHNYQLKH